MMTVISDHSKPVGSRTADVYQAAAELMVEKGFGGTSIADIAKATGMTKAGLYHHISSKQDMLFQIVNHAMDLLEELVIEPAKEHRDGEERLQSIVRNHITLILDRGQSFTVLFSEIRHLSSEQEEEIVSRVSHYKELIKASMVSMSADGKLRDLDVEVAARHLLQIVTGIARWHRLDSSINEEHLIDETIKYIMAAISRD